jgi:hypothetical protein
MTENRWWAILPDLGPRPLPSGLFAHITSEPERALCGQPLVKADLKSMAERIPGIRQCLFCRRRLRREQAMERRERELTQRELLRQRQAEAIRRLATGSRLDPDEAARRDRDERRRHPGQSVWALYVGLPGKGRRT